MKASCFNSLPNELDVVKRLPRRGSEEPGGTHSLLLGEPLLACGAAGGRQVRHKLGLMAEPGWMEAQSSSGPWAWPWPRRHTPGGRHGRATRPLQAPGRVSATEAPGTAPFLGETAARGLEGRGGAGLAKLPPHLGRSSQEGAGAPCCSPGGKQAGPETTASRLLPALSRPGVCSEELCPPLPGGLWGEGV